MNAKLTLTVKPGAIRRGKTYARRHHTSLSHLVENLFLSLSDDAQVSEPAEGLLTKQLLGIGRTAVPNHETNDKALLGKAISEKFQ